MIFDFIKVFPWTEFNNLLGHVYSAHKVSSDGGREVTPNEKQGILEAGRTFYAALEGAFK